MLATDVQGIGGNPVPPGAVPSAVPSPDDAGITFHRLLSAINPLQYLPVIGTIYRAVTGDVIPEPLRLAGASLASGLIFGPVGFLTNLAATIVEKLTGIDPEDLGKSVLSFIGIGARTEPGSQAVSLADQAPAKQDPAKQAPPLLDRPVTGMPPATSVGRIPPEMTRSSPTTQELPPTRVAWTPSQLAAYGIDVTALSPWKASSDQSADILNKMELARIRQAIGAYAASRT